MFIDTGTKPSTNEMEDYWAIYNVLAMHSRGVDRAHAPTLKSAYWLDATVAYGSFSGPAHEFCDYLPDAIRRFARTQHCISNVSVELNGMEARVECYCSAYHYLAQDDGPGLEMTYHGRYLDRMARRGNVWKIQHRQVVMDWNRYDVITAVWEGGLSKLARGERHPDDPLFSHLRFWPSESAKDRDMHSDMHSDR